MPKPQKLVFRLIGIATLAAAGALIAAAFAARPAFAAQELKMVEHATTDAVTDTGPSGDSAGWA